MNIKSYFKQNQKQLLQLVNTEAGRYLVGIKDKDIIVKIVPHGFHQLRDSRENKPIIEAKFFFDYKCRVIAETLTKMDIAGLSKYESFLHFSGLERQNYKYPQIYLDSFSSSTFLGGAGDIVYTHATFSNWRNDSTGTTSSGSFEAFCDKSSGGSYTGKRLYLPIDTSSMGAGAIVTVGTFTFDGNRSLGAPSENIILRITETAQSTTSSLATSEWGNKGSGVAWSENFLEDNNSPTERIMTINSTGLAGITVTGDTLMGVREVTYDIGNSAPTATDGNKFQMTGTKTLALTFTPGASANFFALL